MWYFVFIAFVVAFFIIAANLYRVSHYVPFQLTPNCLLTRYPIIFISGYRSFFYSTCYWNLIPSYLHDHGYQVYTMRLRNSNVNELVTICKQAGHEKLHVFMDSTLAPIASELANVHSEYIKSLTIFHAPQWQPKNTSLHPPKIAIEYMEIPKSHKASHAKGRIYNFLWLLHRITLIPRPAPAIQVIGHPSLKNLESIYRQYLDRAIHLAERDIQEKHL